jgi:K+-sensing histidine kinase KdpD
VQDTGIGISAEDQKHIFDRFFQADMSREHKDESDGAGLGLSIVRWIVGAHQGTIEVHSEEHKGTLFRVRLPLEVEAKPEKIRESSLDDTVISSLKIKTPPSVIIPPAESKHHSE